MFLSFARDGQLLYLGEKQRGEIGTRILSQATQLERPVMRERWYDPAHGYRLVHDARYTFPEADWQLRPDWQDAYISGVQSGMVRLLPDAPAQGEEIEVLEWAELKPGWWYPAFREVRNVVQSADGEWAPSTSNGYREGSVVFGQVFRYDVPRESDPLPSTSHIYLAAEPLDNVPDACFQVPTEWLNTPIQTVP